MSLDIGIGDGVAPNPLPDEPRIGLSGDGYYWFLHPLFERLLGETGQYIDLYGDASFAGEHLAALHRALDDARILVSAQPPEWQVYTGTQTHPVRKDVFAGVEKVRFLQLLDDWAMIVRRAEVTGRPVVCFGD